MQHFRHEKARTANQNQQDQLPRKDGTGAAVMTADMLLPIPAPSTPQTVSDTFPILAFDRLSLLLRRRCQAARPPRTYSAGQLEACYLQTVAYLEIGKGVCHNLRRGADTPGAPVLMIDIRAACDTIHSIPNLIGVARVLRLGGQMSTYVNLPPVKNWKLIGFGPLFFGMSPNSHLKK